MTKNEIVRAIRDIGIIPIVRAGSADEAMRVVDALQAGGLRTVEITLTVPGAIGLLESLSKKIGGSVVLGAGTVLDPETARRAILSGAEYIVSPNLNPEVVRMTRRYGKASLPAGLTPTEVLAAWEAGADFVKVFPCGTVGGADYVKALRAPLPQVEMVPTGGVNLQTVGAFFKAGAAAVGVGGELVDRAAVRQKQWEVITGNARKFSEAIGKARSEMAAGSA